jgi:thiosulfate/3-mercaptopyruvate sulfurtransferase
VETAAPDFARGHIAPSSHPEIVAKAPWVLDKIGKPGYSFNDTRTEGEYLGTTTRGSRQSTGHIAGARRLEWQDAFTDSTDFTPKSIAELGEMWRERVTPGDTVITYCYIGYRASGGISFRDCSAIPPTSMTDRTTSGRRSSIPLSRR